MADRNATIQRKRERFFFEEFSSKAGLDAEIIEQLDAPDIIASISGDVVGVEITEFFVSDESHGGTPQAQESLGDRIVAKAQRLYEESGAPAAHVSICFAPGRSISHLDRDDTAIRIAEFVRRLNLATWQTENWRPAISKAPLPSEISLIHALGVPEYDMAHWCVARAGWVAPLKTESLQLRVNAKATRLEAYRGVIEKFWLLVVADTGRPSSLVDLERDFDPRVIERSDFHDCVRQSKEIGSIIRPIGSVTSNRHMTPNESMKRTSLPVTSFAYAKQSPATVGRLSWC